MYFMAENIFGLFIYVCLAKVIFKLVKSIIFCIILLVINILQASTGSLGGLLRAGPARTSKMINKLQAGVLPLTAAGFDHLVLSFPYQLFLMGNSSFSNLEFSCDHSLFHCPLHYGHSLNPLFLVSLAELLYLAYLQIHFFYQNPLELHAIVITDS